jgi:hypothetical protein
MEGQQAIARTVLGLRFFNRAGHRSWQIRQPAAQSKLRELRQRARSACFVPAMQKMQNNRDFTLSRKYSIALLL